MAKPKKIHEEPMNDIGDFPAVETHVAWCCGLEPSQARRAVEFVSQWRDHKIAAEAFATCESPMERLYLLGFFLKGADVPFPKEAGRGVTIVVDSMVCRIVPQLEVFRRYDPTFECACQHKKKCASSEPPGEECDCCNCDVEPFARVDFAIAVDGAAWRLAVEIDGHDFHERTKEQAAADRQRDRLLTGCGITVLRFTGSEVHADPAGCAQQTVKIIRGLSIRFPVDQIKQITAGEAAE